MKNLLITILTLSLGSMSFAKEIIRHIHWTQPPYDEIVMTTAKDFMKNNPNVEIKIQLVADADMPTKVRTALTADSVDTFAMPNMQSPWFMAMKQQQKLFLLLLERIVLMKQSKCGYQAQ